MQISINRIPYFFPCSVLPFLMVFFFTTVSSYAQETNDMGEYVTEQIASGESYSYITEGRSDPFKPFISPKAATPAGVDPNEIIDENGQLSGMQLFEPGQLTLVAVMLSNEGEIAMVEDQTKKGYILKEGDLIGKRGSVTQIDKEQVVITETAHTRAGKAINSTIIMRLNKEGDK